MERHINCLSVIPILEYAQAHGFSAEILTSGLPVHQPHLEDPRNWLSGDILVYVLNRCESLFKDPLILFKIGRDELIHQMDAALLTSFRLLIAPKLVFKYVGRLTPFFTKLFTVHAESSGNNEALFYVTFSETSMAHRHGCLYTMGWVAGVPIHIWKTRAWIREEACMCRGELESIQRLQPKPPLISSVRFNSDRCVFRLKWVKPKNASQIEMFLDEHEDLISQAILALEDKELSLQEKEVRVQAIEDERKSRERDKRSLLDGLGLSAREQEITQLVAQGKNKHEIAEELYISVETVKKHLNNIFQKVEVKSRTALVAKILGE